MQQSNNNNNNIWISNSQVVLKRSTPYNVTNWKTERKMLQRDTEISAQPMQQECNEFCYSMESDSGTPFSASEPNLLFQFWPVIIFPVLRLFAYSFARRTTRFYENKRFSYAASATSRSRFFIDKARDRKQRTMTSTIQQKEKKKEK